MSKFEEIDEAGKTIGHFVESNGRYHYVTERKITEGIDKRTVNFNTSLLDGLNIFLPAGYPHSVTEDYLTYKIYDALQTMTSTIAGLLANRAVLQGVGVGDATASPTGALLLSVFQDTAGRIATILFAHQLGSSIEPECKRYRLAADIFNDTAMIADCLSPAFPKPMRIMVLSTASIMRALCGVAAGSSKATLTAHFAKAGNLGELNAKDASQSNAISLLGMLLGSLTVSYITSQWATWIAMLLLLTAHLSLNYAAVRAVSMRTLNRQRATILIRHLILHGAVLTPTDVAKHERVFEYDGILRWTNDQVIGACRVGASLNDVLRSFAHPNPHTLQHESITTLDRLLKLFTDEEYLIWYDTRKSEAMIVLKKNATPATQLKAWCHALCTAAQARGLKINTAANIIECISSQLAQTSKLFNSHKQGIIDAGWRLDVTALEVKSGVRLVCMH